MFSMAPYTGTQEPDKKMFRLLRGTNKSNFLPQNFFCGRVVDKFNKLDDKTVSATSMNAFQNNLITMGY